MMRVAEPPESVSSCPCATFHPCVPCQPASPWDQSAWYRTIPAGRGVGVGEGCPVAGAVDCGGTVVDDVPAAQAPSEKSKNPTRNTRSMGLCCKRRGSVWESGVRMNSVRKAWSCLAIGILFLLEALPLREHV